MERVRIIESRRPRAQISVGAASYRALPFG
jgi:hypothetical protein